jgi:hypothetical protein
MNRSLAAKIKAANLALIIHENLDAVGEFFTRDYVAHVTAEEMALGHDGSDESSACIGAHSRTSRWKSRFS